MSMLILAGRLMNALDGATYSSTPAADALFPFSNLSDRNPGTIGKFGSLTAAPEVYADMDYFRGTGGGEIFTGGVPGSPTTLQWTEANTGTGDVTQEAVIKNSGNFSIRLAAGTGIASCFADVTVRSGHGMSLRWYSRGDGVGAAAIIRLRNITTGKFYKSDGTWQTASQNLDSQGGTTFVGGSIQVNVESYDTIQSDTCILRIELSQSVATKTGYFDDVEMVPNIDFVSVHGHNIDPRCSVTLQSSNDSAFGVILANSTLTAKQPSFYAYDPTGAYAGGTFRGSARFWKLKFGDTNTSTSGPIWIGEWVLGKVLVSQTGPAYPMEPSYSQQHVRVPHRFGAPAIYGMGQTDLRTIPLQLRPSSYAKRLELYQEVYQRSRGGWPVVIVPHHTDNQTDVYYGQLADGLPHSWVTRSNVNINTSVEEMGLPLIIA